MAQQISTNTFGVAKWIVDPVLSNGTHNTIASALASASSGQTIFIRPGSYTEDLTLKAGVNLCGFTGDQNHANVIVTGKMTASFSGVCSISNMQLVTNSDFALTLTGANATVVNLYGCGISATNNAPLNSTGSNAASGINMIGCNGNVGTTGIKLLNSTNGTHSWYDTLWVNTGLSTTASTISAGALNVNNCVIGSPFTTSTTGLVVSKYTTWDTSGINTTALTVGGGISQSFYSIYLSGSASAISISSTLASTNDMVTSSNTNAITGAGTIVYNPVSFGSSTGVNVTTQTPAPLGPGGHIGLRTGTPGTGFLGEQIRSTVATGSAVALTSPTAANVTSISLTAGIWDVSGVVMFKGAVTGTATGASINTVSATVGTQGDNYITSPTVPTALDYGITIPSYRISLTSTTTVYLVAIEIYTVGSASAYGRISATRVG